MKRLKEMKENFMSLLRWMPTGERVVLALLVFAGFTMLVNHPLVTLTSASLTFCIFFYLNRAINRFEGRGDR